MEEVNVLNGVFAIIKEKNETSRRSLDRVKRNFVNKIGLSKKIKIGHGGTLDPLAVGVLVVGVGRGCKELGSYLKGVKKYTAVFKIGEEHDTFDRTGKKVKEESFKEIDVERLNQIAQEKYIGKIKQRPPIYSAVKIKGERAYSLARKGKLKEEDVLEREVIVNWIEIRKCLDRTEDFFEMEVECQGGVYIRSLIVSLCREMGTFGSLYELQRTRQGIFNEIDCLSISDCSDIEKVKEAIFKAKEIVSC